MFVPAPATPCAVNVTGLPESPVAVAVMLFVCAAGPSVHALSCARPDTLVATVTLVPVLLAFDTVEPEVAAVNVTTTPATGFPATSTTRTTGAMATAVFTVAVWLLPALSAMDVAAPAVNAIDPEVIDARPVETNWSAYVPADPVIAKPEKVATPLTLVTAVAFDTDPVPRASDAVTETPPVDTMLPTASSRRTDGDGASAEPLSAEDGTLTMARRVAAPAPIEMAPDVTGEKFGALNVSVKLPAVPVIASPLNVATPFPVDAVAFARVPVPDAMDAVMTAPDDGMVLPNASVSRTLGCAERATPLVPAPAGTEMNASCDAGPGTAVAEKVCVGRPVLVAVIV